MDVRRKTDRSRKGGSGVRTKYHRFAGLLLAIVLMIAGICGDTLKVDAAFMRATENTKTSCIEASRAVLTGAECCTAEMLGIRRNTEVRSAALCQVNREEGWGCLLAFMPEFLFPRTQGFSHGLAKCSFRIGGSGRTCCGLYTQI